MQGQIMKNFTIYQEYEKQILLENVELSFQIRRCIVQIINAFMAELETVILKLLKKFKHRGNF